MSERMAVLDGKPQDVCPHCGIYRENAGYLQSSCMVEQFGKEGCFVNPLEAFRGRSGERDRLDAAGNTYDPQDGGW